MCLAAASTLSEYGLDIDGTFALALRSSAADHVSPRTRHGLPCFCPKGHLPLGRRNSFLLMKLASKARRRLTRISRIYTKGSPIDGASGIGELLPAKHQPKCQDAKSECQSSQYPASGPWVI